MRLMVVAKEPVAGRVKTRLCPPLSPEQAAEVAAAALCDTLEAAGATGAHDKVLVLERSPGPWLPEGWRVLSQRGASFAERLSAAWVDCGGPALQIGMDTPQVTTSQLEDSMNATERHGCVIGPATDGGWWALGLRRAEPSAFEGVPMSDASTLRHQIARLRVLGLDPRRLPTLSDVDTWSDALLVATLAPAGRFAAAVAAASLGALDPAVGGAAR